MTHERAILLLNDFKRLLQEEKRVIEATDDNYYARNCKHKLPLLNERINGLDYAIEILTVDAAYEDEEE